MRRTIIWLAGAIIIALLAAIVIPHFARSRFTSSGEPLEFIIKILAKDGGAPIKAAQVQINSQQGSSDGEGLCRIVAFFPAKGSGGRSGRARLWGTLRVTAPGF